MPSIKELTEQRNKAVVEARKVVDAAKAEDRDLSGDERKRCDDWLAEAEQCDEQISGITEGAARSDRLSRLEEAGERSAGRRTPPTEPNDTGRRSERQDEPREMRWSPRFNREVERVVDLAGARGGDEYRRAFRNYLAGGLRGLTPTEERALQADSDVEGGFLNAPQMMLAQLLKGVDDAVPFRSFATVFQLGKSDSMGVPTLDTDQDDPTWTSELATGSEDTSTRFGKRELNPSPLAKRIKISRKLVRTSALSIEQIVRERLAYKFGIAQEKAFMTGTGANQPLGVFTAHADGIPTSRDVSTGNTTTELDPDNLWECAFALKQQYWPNARWYMHRLTLRKVRLMKDGNGQYLWQAGLNGLPGTICDFPYTLSENAPSTYTTGQYVALLGDLSNYWIAEALQLEIQTLTELYAETNQIGYIGRMELDGAPALAEAFVRSKLA